MSTVSQLKDREIRGSRSLGLSTWTLGWVNEKVKPLLIRIETCFSQLNIIGRSICSILHTQFNGIRNRCTVRQMIMREGVMHAWGFMVKVHILPGMWWMGQSRTCQLPHPGSSDRARWGGVKRCDPVTLNEGRIEIGFLYDGYWQPCEFLLMCWFARWFCVIKPMKYREWKRERRTKRKRKQRGLQGANNYINFSMTRIACISPVGCVEWPPQPTVDMAWVSISI